MFVEFPFNSIFNHRILGTINTNNTHFHSACYNQHRFKVISEDTVKSELIIWAFPKKRPIISGNQIETLFSNSLSTNVYLDFKFNRLKSIISYIIRAFDEVTLLK